MSAESQRANTVQWLRHSADLTTGAESRNFSKAADLVENLLRTLDEDLLYIRRLESNLPAVHTDYEGGSNAMAALGDPLDPVPLMWVTVIDEHGPTSIREGWRTPQRSTRGGV